MAVRVGLIGANPERSWASRAHMPALAALPDFQITAVSTTRRESAEAAARVTGASAAFTDASELIRHPEVDVVAVSVKVPDHYEPTLEAIAAGKHVYCEWPLGANTAEAEKLAAAARAAGVVTMVGLQAQASPVLERLQELLAEGYVGRILAASLTGTGVALGGPELPPGMFWAADVTKGANVLTIPAGHAIDALFTCVGEPLDVVGSVGIQNPRARNPETGEVADVTSPDQVVAGGTLANGGAYSVHVQGGTVGNGFRLGVFGSDGWLLASTPGTGIQQTELTLEGARAGESPAPIDVSERRSALPDGQAGNVAALYQRLARTLTDGTPLTPDFDHAVKRHKFLDALVQASETGVRQTL